MKANALFDMEGDYKDAIDGYFEKTREKK